MPASPPTSDWSQSFTTYGPFHGMVVVVILGLVALWCVVGWNLLKEDSRDGMQLGMEGREFHLRRIIAWTIIGTQGFIFVRRMVYFDVQESLPMHLCRLGVWIAAWTLWSLDRHARALTLFWGIGLSTQVLFTPFLTEGYGSITFWIYWINHLQIVGVAVYDIAVLGYRPTWKDLRFASITGLVFSGSVIALNAILGTNYSYLGSGTHEGISIVDKFGPYPIRTLWMSVGSLTIFAMIYGVSKLLTTIRVRVLKKTPVREITPVSGR
ncbi:MAG: TIGR02206 family membrane protein [Phycisphaerales bacterium]|nr:TIGR02206 family membrane protein [Phycisphaerales bacterium]